MELRTLALQALQNSDPPAKCQAVHALWAGQTAWTFGPVQQKHCASPLPGRPDLPRLIAPGQVPARSPYTPEGRAALVHAICHIEFNAINLALDRKSVV